MTLSRNWVGAALMGCLAVQPAPLLAQEQGGESTRPLSAEEALYNADEVWALKPGEEEEDDPCAELQNDPDIIVVCRQSEDPEKFMIEHRTQADSDVTGSGAPRAQDPGGMLQPCEAYTVCVGGVGSVPPPAIMVDFDELPETPEGSDAARLYGGPTDGETMARRIARVGAEPEPEAEAEAPNVGLETLRGIEDDTYGP